MTKPLICIARTCKGCISCEPEIRLQAQEDAKYMEQMDAKAGKDPQPVDLVGLSNRARAAALEMYGIYTKLFNNNGELIKLF